MKRLSVLVIATGWLLCVASFFLMWIDAFRTDGQLGMESFRGWEVARDFLPSTNLGSDPISVLLSVIAFLFYWLSNVLILAGPLALLSNSPRLWKVLQPITLTMMLLNLALLVIFVIHARDMLEVGYYIWCTSYLLVAIALYLGRRARLHTT